ncbi:MFS transporter [Solwaraspora sp. WMMA2080]|uniref:MFS transporter n=1 Tax=unclassified Solwaraspora TaxID=2627926 RepID=UPI00248CCC02|nr:MULTISPECIES: MFS transporter [unclassified Solwaraspora]WBB98022.1 MFS transporter [Solwaraspora sp. WMMA2059]WBC23422.1 MFS transporter [Solwaraspora sp. WMMA2080]
MPSRNAALFVATSVLSGFGSNAMALVTAIWLLDLTGSSSLAALAGLGVYAPTLAGPWLGRVLDMLPRRPAVIAVNLTTAAALLSLHLVRGPGETWLIFAVSLAYGVGMVLRDAGETALLPAAVDAGRIADVNGWRSSAMEGMKLVAPLAGAGLYAWRGGAVVATISAGALVAAAVLYAALRLADHRPSPPTGQVRISGTALHRSRLLIVPVGLAAVAIATSGFQTAATYTVVTDVLDLPATALGALSAAQGAGSIAAGLVAGRLICRHGTISIGAAGAALFAVGLLARCLPWWPGTLASGVVVGVGLPWTLTAAITAIQTTTSPAVLGRVAATANTVMFGPIVLALPLGSAAVHLGSRIPLIVGAGVCFVAAGIAIRARPTPPSHPDS